MRLVFEGGLTQSALEFVDVQGSFDEFDACDTHGISIENFQVEAKIELIGGDLRSLFEQPNFLRVFKPQKKRLIIRLR